MHRAIVASAEEYDFKPGKRKISVTSLLSPPAIRKLMMKYNDQIEEESVDRIWSFFGSICHKMLETADDEFIKEERHTCQIGTWILSGKFDAFDPKTGMLIDNKFVSGSVVKYNPKGKEEWHDQLNILKYILERNGYEVKQLDNLVEIRDWTKIASIRGDMPDKPVLTINVPIYTEDTIKSLINERINVHEEYEDTESIPICSMKERWNDGNRYAVRKKGASRAVNGGSKFDTLIDAENFMKDKKFTEKTHEIELRRGEDKRCLNYCVVNKFCSYYKDVLIPEMQSKQRNKDSGKTEFGVWDD